MLPQQLHPHRRPSSGKKKKRFSSSQHKPQPSQTSQTSAYKISYSLKKNQFSYENRSSSVNKSINNKKQLRLQTDYGVDYNYPSSSSNMNSFTSPYSQSSKYQNPNHNLKSSQYPFHNNPVKSSVTGASHLVNKRSVGGSGGGQIHRRLNSYNHIIDNRNDKNSSSNHLLRNSKQSRNKSCHYNSRSKDNVGHDPRGNTNNYHSVTTKHDSRKNQILKEAIFSSHQNNSRQQNSHKITSQQPSKQPKRQSYGLAPYQSKIKSKKNSKMMVMMMNGKNHPSSQVNKDTNKDNNNKNNYSLYYSSSNNNVNRYGNSNNNISVTPTPATTTTAKAKSKAFPSSTATTVHENYFLSPYLRQSSKSKVRSNKNGMNTKGQSQKGTNRQNDPSQQPPARSRSRSKQQLNPPDELLLQQIQYDSRRKNNGNVIKNNNSRKKKEVNTKKVNNQKNHNDCPTHTYHARHTRYQTEYHCRKQYDDDQGQYAGQNDYSNYNNSKRQSQPKNSRSRSSGQDQGQRAHRQPQPQPLTQLQKEQSTTVKTIKKPYQAQPSIRELESSRVTEQSNMSEGFGLTQDQIETFGDRFPYGFEKSRLLGRGGFSLVWLGEHTKSGKQFAIKQIITNNTHQTHIKQIWFGTMFFTLGGVPKPEFSEFPGIKNLARLYSYEINQTDTWIFYEKCGHSLGSSLYDIKSEKLFGDDRLYKAMSGNPLILKTIIKEICKSLALLAECQVVHSDLKTENILLKFNENENFAISELKLIDYGSSFEFRNIAQFSMATPEYMPPQILNYIIHENEGQYEEYLYQQVMKNYQKPWAVDMWSLGCVMLEMVVGVPLWMSLPLLVPSKTGRSFLQKEGLFAVKGRLFPQIILKQRDVIGRLDAVLENENFSRIVLCPTMKAILKGMLEIDFNKRISPAQVVELLQSQ